MSLPSAPANPTPAIELVEGIAAAIGLNESVGGVAAAAMEVDEVTVALLPGANQNTSFAARNPLKDVIPLLPSAERSVARTDADVLLRRQVKRNAGQKLDAAINMFLEEQKELMEALAKEHNIALSVIQQRCTSSTVYKKERRVNLANAITHAKAKELNKDLAKGERLRLRDILAKVKEEPEENLSKAEKAELIEDLEKHRALKKTGARANNRAAGMDAVFTVARFQEEMSNLHERTGMHAFAFFARGHVDDTNTVEVCETPGALDFIPSQLHFTVQDVVRMFDNYSANKGVRGHLDADDRPAIRAELTKTIKTGLQIASGKRNIQMNYTSFEKTIVDKYRTVIIGWPQTLPFISPSDMGSVVDLRLLMSAWRSGTCRWRLLSNKEYDARKQDQINHPENGVQKTRKERSDKGTTRKRSAADEPTATAAEKPAKRRKTKSNNKAASKASREGGGAAAAKLKKTLPPKSKALIDSDEEEEAQMSDTEDDDE